jgi:hypothetical protein
MTDDLIVSAEPEQPVSAIVLAAAPGVSATREAFAWALPASRALPKDQIARLNVDIEDAPVIVLGALRQILPFRARLAALAEFDVTCLDTLAWHANATVQAQAYYMGVSRGPARVAELAEQVRTWRRLLLQDMTVMVTRRLLPAEKQEELRIQADYTHLPYLLKALVEVYRSAWTELSARTSVRAEELDQAESTANQLIFTFATRAERYAAIKAANEQRQRNFTLLAHAYDQVRRGLTYLRWNEQDVDTIAPSLYRGRGGSRRKAKPQPASAAPIAPAQLSITAAGSEH